MKEDNRFPILNDKYREIYTVQKLDWDNIKDGFPYIEADDNNNGYIFGIEYGVGFDTEQQWFNTIEERDVEVQYLLDLKEEKSWVEIEEEYEVNPLVTNLIQQRIDKGLLWLEWNFRFHYARKEQEIISGIQSNTLKLIVASKLYKI